MSTYAVEIDVFGDERVRAHLRAIMARGLNWRPAFIELERVFEDAERGWYESEGRGSWPQLAASTRQYKATHGLPADTLVRTSRLRDSLTRSTGDSIRTMSTDRFAFGTRAPSARYHRGGTKHMPRRRPGSGVDTRLLTETAAILRAYLVGRLPGTA